MTAVSLSEIAKIPYIDLQNLHGRAISTLSFYTEAGWELWIPTDQGLFQMQGCPTEGYYFAAKPELETDAYLGFLNFIAQRCTWPPVLKPFEGLRQDFFNLCASVKKFDLLFAESAKLQTSTSRLVVTELEYLFSLCRSVFDLLQEVISVQWQSIELLDKSIKKKQLPKSFADVALVANAPRSEQDLMQRFHVPQPLAAFYVRNTPFFSVLRTFRDRFVHGGTTPESVFVTERGFAVFRKTEPFEQFGVWNHEHMLPNELCSLRPVIGHLVVETLRACEDYAATIQSIIQYPPPLVPGMQFYMRGYFNESLAECTKALEACLWWNDA